MRKRYLVLAAIVLSSAVFAGCAASCDDRIEIPPSAYAVTLSLNVTGGVVKGVKNADEGLRTIGRK